jgi:hypothetical protein
MPATNVGHQGEHVGTRLSPVRLLDFFDDPAADDHRIGNLATAAAVAASRMPKPTPTGTPVRARISGMRAATAATSSAPSR